MKILKIVLCFFLLNSTAFAQTKKPNIIFILADDLGIDGVSSYGADLFKTPIKEISKILLLSKICVIPIYFGV